MKKTLSLSLAALLCLLCLTLSVSADEKAPAALVTVTDENGNHVLANEEILLSDADGDGTITVTDALILAHKTECPDGFSFTDAYGEREITSLWGYAGGFYDCYLNGASFYLLTDPIEDGDTVHAFVYRSGEACSDAYSYFSSDTLNFRDGKATLTLYAYTLTEEENLLSEPVKGAVITINGERTGIRTDKQGRFTIHADKLAIGEKNVISAICEDMSIVAPILTVIPEEGDLGGVPASAYVIAAILLIAVLSALFVALHGRKRKK